MTSGESELADAELALAATALQAAEALLKLGLLPDAVSRLYHAAFHAARAALVVRDRHARTHSGQVAVFNATFGPTPLLSALLERRIDADYRPGRFTETATQVQAALDEAAAFVLRCRDLVTEEADAKGVTDPDPAPDL